MPSNKKAAAQQPVDQEARIAQLAQQVEHLAAALENAETRLKEMGIADATTGLYSYRYFLGRAAEEVARADRFSLEVSCLMIGLDRAGLEGMLEVARMLKEQCRVYDIPARWGQNELVMLLPATDLDGALTFGERLRLSVAEAFADHAGLKGLTVSLGAASYPTKGVEDAQGLVEAVDTACYKATQAGGNRTVVRG
ncbi:MAG: diguanylate cyclase [Cyanobacteria bacterium RYN_339]|nr:diguanylate cyclase [Cyanobacteria bacterium RYN_339]